MSTRAIVGIQQKDGTIQYKKIFSDGMPYAFGAYCLEHCNKNSKNAFFNYLYNDDEFDCSKETYVAKDETDFLKSTNFQDYQYLFKDGDWYYQSSHYWDGLAVDGSRVELANFEPDPKGWRLLKDRFIKKRKVIYEYIEKEDLDD